MQENNTTQDAIEKIIDSIIFIEDEDISEKLREGGFKVLASDTREEGREHSEKVDWSAWYDIENNDVKCRLNLYGTGIKNISYDRWVDTDCIIIDDWDFSVIES